MPNNSQQENVENENGNNQQEQEEENNSEMVGVISIYNIYIFKMGKNSIFAIFKTRSFYF